MAGDVVAKERRRIPEGNVSGRIFAEQSYDNGTGFWTAPMAYIHLKNLKPIVDFRLPRAADNYTTFNLMQQHVSDYTYYGLKRCEEKNNARGGIVITSGTAVKPDYGTWEYWQKQSLSKNVDLTGGDADWNDDLNYLFDTVIQFVLVNSNYSGLGGQKLTNDTNTVMSCCELRPVDQKQFVNLYKNYSLRRGLKPTTATQEALPEPWYSEAAALP